MMNFLFKTGTYLFIWKKFKSQIISILISLFLIFMIFSIYEDLIKIAELKNTSTLLYLLLGKWFIVSIIVLFNIISIKNHKKDSEFENEIFKDEIVILPIKSQEILNKKDILTTTDLILKKYRSNNDNS